MNRLWQSVVAGFCLVFALTALLLAPDQFSIEAAGSSGCGSAASKVWLPVRNGAFRTEAFSVGPSCPLAVVTLVIRAPDGAPLWADAMPASNVMTFSRVRGIGSMSAALREWLSQNHLFRTSFDLPVWTKGEGAPKAGEFPFYPDEAVDHEYYERVRAERLPVFCYVQGMESLACIVLKDGAMMKIGLQSFPG